VQSSVGLTDCPVIVTVSRFADQNLHVYVNGPWPPVTCATKVQDTGELLVALQSPPDTMYPALKLLGADGVVGVVGVVGAGAGGVGLVGVDSDSPPEQPAASIRTTARPHHAEMRWTAMAAASANRIPCHGFPDLAGISDRRQSVAMSAMAIAAIAERFCKRREGESGEPDLPL
jgi:hypothetical protein